MRFVIFGAVSDPRKYRSYFSLKDFNASHEEYARDVILQCIEKRQLEVIGKTSAKSKAKTVKKPASRAVKRTVTKSKKFKNSAGRSPEKSNPVGTPASSAQLSDHWSLGSLDQDIRLADFVSSSSLLEQDVLSQPRTQKTSEFLSQSSSSFSSNRSSVKTNEQSQKRSLSIDDLIHRKYKKLKTSQ